MKRVNIGFLKSPSEFHQKDASRIVIEIPRTARLAAGCHKNAAGDPYFLKYLVTMLHDEQWIQFNLGSLKSAWDGATIQRKALPPNMLSSSRTKTLWSSFPAASNANVGTLPSCRLWNRDHFPLIRRLLCKTDEDGQEQDQILLIWILFSILCGIRGPGGRWRGKQSIRSW